MAVFNLTESLQKLKHYLPHQAPLKDFVHHNTLGSFQELPFEEAISRASKMFGYKTSLNIQEYRALYKKHLIREDILEQTIIKRKGQENPDQWIHNLFHKQYDISINSRIGFFRALWKSTHQVDLDHEINNILFKLLGGYLDQGIAQWHFPFSQEGFLASVRELENNSLADFVRTKLGMQLLGDESVTIEELLDRLVGDPTYYENYLFEQQFSHPGWSGMVAMIEKYPNTLMDVRPIALEDLIKFELILEIDVIEHHKKNRWKPLSAYMETHPDQLFAPTPRTLEDQAIMIWQEAYEWSYYDSVLAGIQKMHTKTHRKANRSFQALFCIDDREGSIRRHIEQFDARCETYGTPGHFGIGMYYQPQNSKFYTKVCPGSLTPKHLVKEVGSTEALKPEVHFSNKSNHPIWSVPYALLTGFWSGLMMFFNIFKPSFSTMATSSFSHMGKNSKLSILHTDTSAVENGLQIGFTLEEMTDIVEGVFKSIGLVGDFSTLIYAIGHGGSSINNTHYAGYDCGACSGRPGSVNARVFASMANHQEVKKKLRERGIELADHCQVLGGLHDTTRDDFEFYDEDLLTAQNKTLHLKNLEVFKQALDMNAKERSRRFFSINSKKSAESIHKEIRNRSISLFEPRPELNHATNSLCIVGRHSLHEGLFLDRRAFSNSYDYSLDPSGDLLFNILNAAVPVCGGINLEYYFSRVDNQKLGAGSKLPHNVMGLIGVTNGVEGDLRTGLPLQMIELHDPIRLMMVVEHYPEVALEVVKRNPSTYEWINNEWIVFVVIHPDTYQTYRFENGSFKLYQPLKKLLDTLEDVDSLVESHDQNLPVYLIKKA